MHTGERETCAVVVELRVHPSAGAMALLAGLREVRADVVGIRSALEVFQVTGDASGAGQVVVVVNVTIGAGAWWHGVQSGQRKTCAVVIERGIQPCACAMALLAGLREVRSRVVGIGRTLKVLEVAGHAGRAAQIVVIVDVTIGAGAWRHGM